VRPKKRRDEHFLQLLLLMILLFLYMVSIDLNRLNSLSLDMNAFQACIRDGYCGHAPNGDVHGYEEGRDAEKHPANVADW
jgi:hypothetical protein